MLCEYDHTAGLESPNRRRFVRGFTQLWLMILLALARSAKHATHGDAPRPHPWGIWSSRMECDLQRDGLHV